MRNEVPGRRTLFLMLTLVVIVLVFWQMAAQRLSKAPSSGAEIAEVGPQTLAQMLSMGKPGILEFYTGSCPSCIKIAPELARVSSTYGAGLFVVRMNAEKYPAEASKYKVEVVPTLVYFGASGTQVAAVPGYMDFDALVKNLKQLKMIE